MSPDLWAPLPGSFATSREHLHQVAFFAISPARYNEVGRMGLRPTIGGFGSPEFNGKVVRVEGDLLVVEADGNVATQTISSVRSAAEFASGGYREVWFADFHDPLAPIDPDAPLSVDAAHIVDMHQLTKDPERVLRQGPDTKSSPKRTMTQFELSRYLDYCSEMMSLIGKVAALYVQEFADEVAVSAVNDIENLTTGMARKIWQKLMVLGHVDEAKAQ